MESYTAVEKTSTNNESYAERRDNMLELVGGAMKFETRAKKVFRHKPSATMVRQLLFWGDKGHDPEGYIYKTYPEWWDEEGLTRTELDTARYKLGPEGFGVLEEDRKGVFNRLHYRLDLERLREVMFPELDAPTDEDPVPEDQTLNHDFTVQDSSSIECRASTVQSAGIRPSHYREYTKKTSKNPPGGATAPRAGESIGKDQVPKISKTSTLSANGENQRHKAARELEEKLSADLEAVGVLLDDGQREKYRINFKRLIDKDVDAGELEKTADRIVERWSSYQLSPQQALGDVRGGMGDKAKGTTPAGVKYIREYTSSGRSPGDRVGPSIAATRERLVDIAEGFDFTSDKEVPMPIRLQISDYPRECDEMIYRLRKMTRRAVEEDADRRRRAMGMDPEGSATPTESVSPALEEAPEGSSTPEAAEGDSTTEAVERLLSDPESKAARLARAVVAGKSSPHGPITTEDVSAALLDEVDLEALGWPASLGREREMSARMMAAILIRRLRDQAGEE